MFSISIGFIPAEAAHGIGKISPLKIAVNLSQACISWCYEFEGGHASVRISWLSLSFSSVCDLPGDAWLSLRLALSTPVYLYAKMQQHFSLRYPGNPRSVSVSVFNLCQLLFSRIQFIFDPFQFLIIIGMELFKNLIALTTGDGL